ncbi:MAG: T9SS type A sorting domain-containing protein [Bacteroidota bacterium]
MRKLFYLIPTIVILVTSNILASETFPIKLKYGENVLSIRIINETSSLLKSLNAEFKGNELPDGISIFIITNSIEVLPNAKSNNKLQLRIYVKRDCKPGTYKVPFTIYNSSTNKWYYFLELNLENSIVSNFELNQNYPNPFNGTTNIQYSLPANTKENVRLLIYDLLGRQIRILVDEEQKSGTYNVTWNGTDDLGKPCASGIYFYRIKTNTFQDVKKIVFLE